MKNKINVVFIVDEIYLPHFCVALGSLLKNNLEIVDKIFLIHDLANENKILKVLKYFSRIYSAEVLPIKMQNTSEFQNFTITRYATRATYYRLALADILPKDINSVLYLDSDLIVSGSLVELTNIHFSEQCIAFAVNHPYHSPDFLIEHGNKFEVTYKKYFNSGVMFLNLDLMRRLGSTNKLLKIATKYNEYLEWWDQDALNVYFIDMWDELDFSYNTFGLGYNNKTYLPISNSVPKIIHYTGHRKPWIFPCKHPYVDLYWKYAKGTPFYWSIYVSYFLNMYYIKLKSIIPKVIKDFIKSCMGK